MLKIINSHKRRKELNFRIIASVLILTLLIIFPAAAAAAANNLEFSHSAETGAFSEQAPAEVQGEAGSSIPAFTPYENPEIVQDAGKYVDVTYMLGGIGAAVLIFFMYPRITRKANRLRTDFSEIPNSLKIRKIIGIENADLDRIQAQRIRLFTVIPVLFIALAELLIFSGRMGAAVWVHIGTLIALSLSYAFIKDKEIHKIHMALMLLPVLRLINLSMPVFFETTLYTFIFVYGPLAIPVVVIVMHERSSFKEIGITTKNFLPYMLLSVPLGFLLGLGEYLTIRTGYLIPDLAFWNLLKLTLIMVFFVGLVEELIFRTILQTRLEHALSLPEALVITSLLFGLMHSGYGTYHEILYTGFVGFIMGLAFYKTRSLPFVAVLHGFVNVFLFGILPHHLIGWTWI